MLNEDYKEMLQILSKTKSQQVVKKINLMQNICVGIAMPNIMPNYESVETLYTSNAGHQIPGYQVVAIRLSEHQVGFS